jgi:4-hydroxymandelate oxidase
MGSPSEVEHSTDSHREGARRRLPLAAFDFLDGGAGDEVTLRANTNAYSRWSFLPRVCIDVEHVDTRVTLSHASLDVPFFVAPSGTHRLFHPDAEWATASAARDVGAAYVTSTAASVSMEDVATVAPDERWFQLYCFRDRAVVDDLVDRAALAGYRALVVTVDAPVLGTRKRDLRNGFSVGPDIKWANLEPYGAADLSSRSDGSVVAQYFAEQIDPSVAWVDLARLIERTHLPVYVKGVLHSADAQRACDIGASGVYVSNHGGRQLDRVPATLDALGPIVDSVGASIDVIVDGGVRSGADVCVALALGARAVGLGRSPLYALADAGRRGVETHLEALRSELVHTLQLLGVPRARDLDRQALAAHAGVSPYAFHTPAIPSPVSEESRRSP